MLAYLQSVRGEFTAALNGWEDAELAVEIAGHELAVAAAKRTGLGGRAPLLAQLCRGLAVGVALLASSALRRTAWARPRIAGTSPSSVTLK